MCVWVCVCACSQLNLDGNEIVWFVVQRPFSILFAGRLTLVWYLMFPLQRWHNSSNQLQFQALFREPQRTGHIGPGRCMESTMEWWVQSLGVPEKAIDYWQTPRHVTMYKMYKPLILDLLVTSLTVAGWTLTRSNVEHGWTIIFHPSIAWLTVNIHQPSITFIFHI